MTLTSVFKCAVMEINCISMTVQAIYPIDIIRIDTGYFIARVVANNWKRYICYSSLPQEMQLFTKT